ncbi:tetratricopeptide (TPR) repeat protein [Deinobacterium chartae]|uniref:Tetratricopeptide (TPR) repeat protein n=1 Tax=Deinobacterium chartae TaxID=521158 RepID=A0A841HXU7_9DEIO|nr:tetratricopeptide (TPR) repeat protein [Deinobacterium chartae]
MPTPPAPQASRALRLLAALSVSILTLGSAQAQTPPANLPVLEQQVRTNPTPENQLALGRAYLEAARYRDAQRLFEAVISRDYTSFDAHFGLGQALFALGDLIGARFEFSQLVNLAPERLEAHYNLGVVLARAGQSEAAEAAFTRAIEVGRDKAAPDALASAYRSLADLQRARGAYADAATNYREALTRTPGDVALSLDLAESLFRAESSAAPATGQGAAPATNQPAGQTATSPAGAAAALPYAYAVLSKDPGNVRAASLIADIYASQNLLARGLRELDAAVQAAPLEADKARLLLKRGELLVAAGREREALTAYQGAAQLDRSNAEARYQYGRLLLKTGQTARALEEFSAAVQAAPQRPEPLLGLAGAQEAAGQLDAARASAERAAGLTQDPAIREAADLIAGRVAYRRGQYAAALAKLRPLAARSGSAEVQLWTGLAAYAVKDYAGAVSALEAAAKADPSALVQANLGAAYLAAGRYNEAEATLSGVVAAAPRNAEAWYNLGWALRNLGRDAEARTAFRTSLNLGYARAKGALGN